MRRHHLDMKLMHFQTLRSGVQINASPATEQALVAMENNLRDALTGTGLFDSVEVEHTDDPDQLVVALCQYRPNLDEDEVAATVERLWDERISYTFWEVHSVRVDDGFVELEGATRESIVGRYATLHLVAQRSQVPSQRGPVF
jgi:hypothetical protein